MRSNTARALIGVGALVAVVVLFVVLSGDDDNGESNSTTAAQTTTEAGATGNTGTTTAEKPSRPRPVTVVVRGGNPVGGVKRIEVESGERIRFVVRSDVADEVHVHGYDRSKDVAAGGSVRFDFPATLEGVFEVELEERHEQVAELRVEPS